MHIPGFGFDQEIAVPGVYAAELSGKFVHEALVEAVVLSVICVGLAILLFESCRLVDVLQRNLDSVCTLV